MSYSRPVLVSDIPENLEVAGGIALTFAARERFNLARALSRMLSLDDAEGRRLGAAARERIVSRYTWDHVARETEALYRRLVNVRRNAC